MVSYNHNLGLRAGVAVAAIAIVVAAVVISKRRTDSTHADDSADGSATGTPAVEVAGATTAAGTGPARPKPMTPARPRPTPAPPNQFADPHDAGGQPSRELAAGVLLASAHASRNGAAPSGLTSLRGGKTAP